MSRVNLLPWREAVRKERQNQFIATIGVVAAIALAVWGAVHFLYIQKIDYQASRNSYIESNIKALDKKIAEIKELEKQKQSLLARMRAIEQLQGNRPLIVRLFDEIVMSLPDGVSLSMLKQKGKEVTITGAAESNARVSSFMRNMEKSEWIQKPSLDIIETKSEQNKKISNFTLRFSQYVPNAEEDE